MVSEIQAHFTGKLLIDLGSTQKLASFLILLQFIVVFEVVIDNDLINDLSLTSYIALEALSA